MQHLRDNEGVLEASNNGTDWETVVLGEGGGGPLTNPFTLGAIQVRSSGSILELSRDAGSTWQRVWDTGANSLSLLDKVFSPPIIVTDDQPGTWSLTIGTISLWWEPTAVSAVADLLAGAGRMVSYPAHTEWPDRRAN